MVEKLLLPPSTTQAPQMRITGLVLSSPSQPQVQSLDAILRAAGSTARNHALTQVAQNPDLWLGTLRPAFLDSHMASIKLLTWRRSNGNLFAWSGLTAVPGETLPHLIIDPDPENRTTKLQVRWKAEPDPLPRGSVTYEASVIGGDQVLASRQVEHTGTTEQEIIFTTEDFEDLDSSSKLEAYAEISVPAQTNVKSARTEGFIITFGEASSVDRVSSGQVFRCLADGLVQAESRDALETFLDQRQKGEQACADKHGFKSHRPDHFCQGIHYGVDFPDGFLNGAGMAASFPKTVTVKGIPRISATIYRQKQTKGNAIYTSYRLAYSLLEKVKRETFSDLGKAEAAAADAIRRIAGGEQAVLQLVNRDRDIYQRSVGILAPFNIQLDVAASECAEVRPILNGSGTPVEAARFFM
jgi:hypothetical protein